MSGRQKDSYRYYWKMMPNGKMSGSICGSQSLRFYSPIFQRFLYDTAQIDLEAVNTNFPSNGDCVFQGLMRFGI